MVDFTLSSGENKVLATGSVFSFKSEPITVTLDPDDEHDSYISVTFQFIDDENNDPSVSFELTGENSGIISLKNMNSPSGFGAFDPHPIASNGDSTLFLSFRVSKPRSQESRLLDFTFFSVNKPKVHKKSKQKAQKKIRKNDKK